MKWSVRAHPAGFSIFTVLFGESEVELSEFGGQMLSWSVGGKELLFSNAERAVMDGKTPYRGGSPICFPYFGKGALLPGGPTLSPQHGRSRSSVWQSEVREAESSIVMRTSQNSPDGFGPTALSCELVYRFDGGVSIVGSVENLGGNSSPFQIAVHSYWACGDPSGARVLGLGDQFLDNLAGLIETVDEASTRPHLPPFDRVYPDASAEMSLETAGYRVGISTKGCAGAVLWNPGVHHGLGDLGSPDFVCVESGVVAPPGSLAPGAKRAFEINYRVES